MIFDFLLLPKRDIRHLANHKITQHYNFSFLQNTFFLKKEPVLRKKYFFGKAFFSKEMFVLKEKQIGFLVKLFACKKVCVNLVESRGF